MLSEDKELFIVNIDSLTYAGNLESLPGVREGPRYAFHQVGICDAAGVQQLLERYKPQAIMHLAAESHVDRSIDGPGEFVRTNVVGTCTLLQETLDYWKGLTQPEREGF